jgi:hypothetical protein
MVAGESVGGLAPAAAARLAVTGNKMKGRRYSARKEESGTYRVWRTN